MTKCTHFWIIIYFVQNEDIKQCQISTKMVSVIENGKVGVKGQNKKR